MATITEQSTLTKKQVKIYGPKPIRYGGESATITAAVRFDDECGNGHNSFAITGTIRSTDKRRGDNGYIAGGCIHEEIAHHFPQLAPFLKWHLSSTDGPMHYVANTTYHASDRDHYGRAAGEPSSFEHGVRFDGVPITHRVNKQFFSFLKSRYSIEAARHNPDGSFQVVAIAHDNRPGDHVYSPHYTFAGFGEKWHECPFRDKTEAEEFCEAMNKCTVEFVKVPTAWSEGKPRELDAARRCAVWPEATDEELTAPGLKERLEARLPALLAAFRADVESLGLVW